MRRGAQGVRPTIGLAVVVAAWLAVGSAPALAEPRTIDLAIRDGALGKSPQVIRVQQGDDVTLRWRTDKPVTLHLHGYDIETKVTPQAPATMQFKAQATGRFPIELHAAGGRAEKTIAYLEVHPR